MEYCLLNRSDLGLISIDKPFDYTEKRTVAASTEEENDEERPAVVPPPDSIAAAAGGPPAPAAAPADGSAVAVGAPPPDSAAGVRSIKWVRAQKTTFDVKLQLRREYWGYLPIQCMLDSTYDFLSEKFYTRNERNYGYSNFNKPKLTGTCTYFVKSIHNFFKKISLSFRENTVLLIFSQKIVIFYLHFLFFLFNFVIFQFFLFRHKLR